MQLGSIGCAHHAQPVRNGARFIGIESSVVIETLKSLRCRWSLERGRFWGSLWGLRAL